MLFGFGCFYLGGLIVLTMNAVSHPQENTAWDLEEYPGSAIPRMLLWPITLPISFLITRLKQI